VVLRTSLTSGRTQSCGCFQKEGMKKRFTKHGMYQAKEYQLWGEMIQRCTNPNNIGWKYYGGRGITVCDRWRYGDDGLSGFECFLLDVGLRPGPEYAMDRFPDKHGPYVKSNFRWATPQWQK
jgi:hypothetical protein